MKLGPAIAAAGALVAWPARAWSQPATCPDGSAAELEATRGQVRLGATCGTFVLETDGTELPFSYAVGRWGSSSEPLEVRVRMRRLTADRGALEIGMPGGTVLLRDGHVGFYVSAAQFAADDWRPLADLHQRDDNLIVVRQVGDTIELELGGRPVGRWQILGLRGAGDVGIQLKGARGFRGRALVRDLRVRALRTGVSAGNRR